MKKIQLELQNTAVWILNFVSNYVNIGVFLEKVNFLIQMNRSQALFMMETSNLVWRYLNMFLREGIFWIFCFHAQFREKFKIFSIFWNEKLVFPKLGMKIKNSQYTFSWGHNKVPSYQIRSFNHEKWLTSIHLNPKNQRFEKNGHLCACSHVFRYKSQYSNSRNFGSSWNFLIF